MIPRASCLCCPSGCCQCWLGSDRSGGGCCYGHGDRIRLTVPRDALPSGVFGGVGACWDDCYAPGFPSLAHTYCCGEQGMEAAEEFWCEYEWQEPCVVMEFAEDEQILPDPTPFIFPPPGPGALPPYGGGGTLPPPEDPDVYCHVVHVFVAVEFSASVVAYGEAGGDIGCIFPLEWLFVCSGCKKFPAQESCALPADHRPASDLPCAYTGPSGDFYLAARPALGWTFVCDPVQPYPCPFCVGVCLVGPPGPCISHTTAGEQILDAGGSPLYCGVDACAGDPCCVIPGEIDPSCLTTVTMDLTRCDGGVICCHKRQWRRISCDPEDGYHCVDLGSTQTTLRRVDPKACVWVEEQPARCRPRTPTDPVEPVDVPEDCPP